MNIILCGLPGSGKTTIGKKIAEIFGYVFVDTDKCIEAAHRFSCREIFKAEGEAFFRQLEAKVIRDLQGMDNTLVALGGGTLELSENRALLKQMGTIIYLKKDPKEIWKKIDKKNLPAYLEGPNPEKTFFSLASLRIPLYEEVSSVTLEIDFFRNRNSVKIKLY